MYLSEPRMVAQGGAEPPPHFMENIAGSCVVKEIICTHTEVYELVGFITFAKSQASCFTASSVCCNI